LPKRVRLCLESGKCTPFQGGFKNVGAVEQAIENGTSGGHIVQQLAPSPASSGNLREPYKTPTKGSRRAIADKDCDQSIGMNHVDNSFEPFHTDLQRTASSHAVV
jgi:hypothetical protein